MKLHRTQTLRALLPIALLVAPVAAQTSQHNPPANLGAGGCGAQDAYTNVTPQLKIGYDYIPVGNDDSNRFYVAYSAKIGAGPGGVGNTVGVFVVPLINNEILIFGAGYGDPEYAPGFGALFDSATDVANVDQAVRGCMGLQPEDIIVRFVAPHGHPDHINSYFMRELRLAGYTVAEIVFHQNDQAQIMGLPGWTGQDFMAMNPIGGGGCNVELYGYESPLGHVWFTLRSGHTPGSMDLVLDIGGDPQNRVLMRGSAAGGYCAAPPSGIKMRISAHGTVFFNGQVQARATVRNGAGMNPEILASTTPPRIGEFWRAEIDASQHPGATLTWLIGFYSPLDAGFPTVYGELLVETAYFGGALVFDSVMPPLGDGIGHHAIPVSNDISLLGMEIYSQGVITGGYSELTNAVDLILGN